jgi:uncharacterized protein (DUF1697 family)
VTSYVALLRGVNVGSGNRVSMADLKRVVESLGHKNVRTYVNSGNVVFSSDSKDGEQLSAALERAVAAELGISPNVLVRSGRELAEVVAGNPYPNEPDPKKVHVLFLPKRLAAADSTALDKAQQEAAGKGSGDEYTVEGREVYLHLPDGMGRSILMTLLARRFKVPGTARNWSTVTKLSEMCGSG